MAGRMVQIDSRDGGRFEAYFAAPASGKGPGLVILPEIYNSNHWVRAVADGYAKDGYVCIAPDIYWREAPGTYLDYTPEGQKQGREMGFALDLDKSMDDLGCCADWLRSQGNCTGKVGSVGYCLGGKLVYLGMARKVLDAGVGYYSVQLNNHYDEAKNIDGPLMLHFGELDTRIPPDMLRDIHSHLDGKPNVTIYEYEGADHGFNRFGYPPFHEECARIALERTLQFLGKELA
jgi:carboxymethylenebutenolidase